MAKLNLAAKLGSIKITRRGFQKVSPRARGAKASVDVFGIFSKLKTFARSRWRVFVILGATLAAACYYTLLAPATERLDTVRDRETALEERSTQLLGQINALQSAEGAAAAAARFDRAQFYNVLLPRTLNQLSLLADLNDMFDTAGLEIRELSPVLDVVNLNPSSDPELGYFAFQFAASGTDAEVGALIDAIEEMQPLATIANLSLTAQGPVDPDPADSDADGGDAESGGADRSEQEPTMAITGTIRVWASTGPDLDSLRS